MDYLPQTSESMKYQGSRGTLTELIRILKIKPAGMKKARAVEILHLFYSNQYSAAKLFQGLNAYEKALLTCIVQSEYRLLEEDIKEIAEQYKHSVN